MKRIKKFPGMMIAMLVLCMSLSMTAFAAETPVFQDVPVDSPWYDGVTYAAENGITSGTGNGCFTPDQNITARQWAVMLCRAYDKEVEPIADRPFGTAEMKLAYKEGWLDLGAMVAPDSAMCRRYAYESIFRIERIPVFSSELYASDGWDSWIRTNGAGVKGRCLSRLAISQSCGDPRRTRTGHCNRERVVS